MLNVSWVLLYDNAWVLGSRVLWTRHVRPWVWDKPVAVRHLDGGKCCGIEHSLLSDDAVLMEQPGRDRIDLLRRERLRGIEGHRSMNVIIEGCGVRPITPYGFQRCRGRQRLSPPDQPIHWSFRPRGTMALRAFGRIHCCTLRNGTAAGRQPCAIRSDIDLPRTNVFGSGRPAQVDTADRRI